VGGNLGVYTADRWHCAFEELTPQRLIDSKLDVKRLKDRGNPGTADRIQSWTRHHVPRSSFLARAASDAAKLQPCGPLKRPSRSQVLWVDRQRNRDVAADKDRPQHVRLKMP
jgi:hypothetical protein